MPDSQQRLGESGCIVRRATLEDVPGIVELLRDDTLGSTREGGDAAGYERAFREIDGDPRQFLAVVESTAENADGALAGTMQLTLIPGLSRGGATRLQIEAVRVAAGHRGAGLGGSMLAWAEQHGRRHGATLVQLTTDKSRAEAHRFYERHGYTASHEGFKKPL